MQGGTSAGASQQEPLTQATPPSRGTKIKGQGGEMEAPVSIRKQGQAQNQRPAAGKPAIPRTLKATDGTTAAAKPAAAAAAAAAGGGSASREGGQDEQKAAVNDENKAGAGEGAASTREKKEIPIVLPEKMPRNKVDLLVDLCVCRVCVCVLLLRDIKSLAKERKRRKEQLNKCHLCKCVGLASQVHLLQT